MFRSLFPLAVAVALPITGAAMPSVAETRVSAAASGWSVLRDSFNPLPFHSPISRTRMQVMVLDETTECPRIWSRLSCPFVVMPDGTRRGMVIGNFEDRDPGPVTVERIEYPSEVMLTDAWPL